MNSPAQPFVVIATLSRGRKIIWPKLGPDKGAAQLRYFLMGAGRNVQIIDANGRYFTNASVSPKGIYWSVYLQNPLIGVVVALISAVFLTVLVRFEVSRTDAVTPLSLEEAKNIVIDVVQSNPSRYTHSSAHAVVSKVRRAKDIESMFDAVFSL